MKGDIVRQMKEGEVLSLESVASQLNVSRSALKLFVAAMECQEVSINGGREAAAMRAALSCDATFNGASPSFICADNYRLSKATPHYHDIY